MKLRLWHVCPPESTIKLPRQVNTPELDSVVLKSHQATLPWYPRTVFILLVPLFPLSSPYQPFSFFYFFLFLTSLLQWQVICKSGHNSSLFLALSRFPIERYDPFLTPLESGCSVSFFDEYCCCCCYLVAKLCLTLCDPMDLTHQAPVSMGFPR